MGYTIQTKACPKKLLKDHKYIVEQLKGPVRGWFRAGRSC